MYPAIRLPDSFVPGSLALVLPLHMAPEEWPWPSAVILQLPEGSELAESGVLLLPDEESAAKIKEALGRAAGVTGRQVVVVEPVTYHLVCPFCGHSASYTSYADGTEPLSCPKCGAEVDIGVNGYAGDYIDVPLDGTYPELSSYGMTERNGEIREVRVVDLDDGYMAVFSRPAPKELAASYNYLKRQRELGELRAEWRKYIAAAPEELRSMTMSDDLEMLRRQVEILEVFSVTASLRMKEGLLVGKEDMGDMLLKAARNLGLELEELREGEYDGFVVRRLFGRWVIARREAWERLVGDLREMGVEVSLDEGHGSQSDTGYA